MSECGCSMAAHNAEQRATLRWLLAINAAMFIVELLLGWWAQSSGLLADSLDMLADASVYAISLYAVGRSLALQRGAARLSGVLQIGLALLVLSDVLRRFWFGSEPLSPLILVVATLALLANILCLRLIARHREDGVHMRASYIFSKNDVLANLGVMCAALLVWLFENRYPDLLIGMLIAVLVLRGGLQILREAAVSGDGCDDGDDDDCTGSACAAAVGGEHDGCNDGCSKTDPDARGG